MKRFKLFLGAILGVVTLTACGGYVHTPPEYQPPHDELPIYAPSDDVATERTYVSGYTNHGALSAHVVEFMSENFYNRVPFSYQEKYAALWIANELLAMGFDADDIHLQEFSIDEKSRSSWYMPGRRIYGPTTVMREYSQNVVLTIPGTGAGTIIIGAHYDGMYVPGASDNASGAGLLLESAYLMRDADNYHTLTYVFFGAEEIGLVGAYVFLESLSQDELDDVLFVFNADVLLEGAHLFFANAVNAPTSSASDIFDQINYIAQSVYNDFGITIHSRDNLAWLPSDHIVFLNGGLPVVLMAGKYVIDGHFSEMFPRLHTPLDNIHFINENYPGMIETSMRYATIFLYRITNTNFNN